MRPLILFPAIDTGGHGTGDPKRSQCAPNNHRAAEKDLRLGHGGRERCVYQSRKPHDKPNMVCGPVQVCWEKFARYWDVELREIPMEKNRLIMNAEEAVKRCDENTIGVVPTLGVTFTGQYEPVEQVSKALDKLQKSK